MDKSTRVYLPKFVGVNLPYPTVLVPEPSVSYAAYYEKIPLKDWPQRTSSFTPGWHWPRPRLLRATPPAPESRVGCPICRFQFLLCHMEAGLPALEALGAGPQASRRPSSMPHPLAPRPHSCWAPAQISVGAILARVTIITIIIIPVWITTIWTKLCQSSFLHMKKWNSPIWNNEVIFSSWWKAKLFCVVALLWNVW